MAQQALGIAGAVVGGVIGGPAGAQIGFAIGSAIGGMIDPPEVQGQKIGEVPVQTGTTGVPVAVGMGMVAVHGNIIQTNPGETFIVKTKQGKGGGTTIKSEHYKQTYAIGIIKGPAAGLRRVWRNEKLVYDESDNPQLTAAENAEFENSMRLYYGDESQTADPDLEAEQGVGNQPYYRGLMYIVFPDHDLTEFGNAIPQYMFEVLMATDHSSTSKPYPIEDTVAIQPTTSVINLGSFEVPQEGISLAITPLDGTLRALLKDYTIDPEAIDNTVILLDGELTQKLEQHTIAPEGIDTTIVPLDGLLKVALIAHEIEPEGIQPSITLLDGTIT